MLKVNVATDQSISTSPKRIVKRYIPWVLEQRPDVGVTRGRKRKRGRERETNNTAN